MGVITQDQRRQLHEKVKVSDAVIDNWSEAKVLAMLAECGIEADAPRGATNGSTTTPSGPLPTANGSAVHHGGPRRNTVSPPAETAPGRSHRSAEPAPEPTQRIISEPTTPETRSQ